MNIQYKLLTSAHISAYRQIRLECLQAYPDFFGTDYADEAKATTLKFDTALQQNSQLDFLFGAFQGDSLIGICGFTQERRTKTKHRGEVSHMYVKGNFAGQGIGTKLLQLTLHKAFRENNLELVTLGVVDTNATAIAIYKKSGFVQYGFLENYFKQATRSLGFFFMALTRANYLKGDE